MHGEAVQDRAIDPQPGEALLDRAIDPLRDEILHEGNVHLHEVERVVSARHS